MTENNYQFDYSLLPLERMQQILADGAAERYQTAKPFPHIAIDNFFEPQILDKVLEEFPNPNDIDWKKFKGEYEVKLASKSECDIPYFTRYLLYCLNSATFLEFLQQLTGIDNLIPDPYFEGGGLHQIVSGGKLGVHVDFNKHRKTKLDRRLNILVYLNKDWQDEYGGCLGLWDKEVKNCEQSIAPIFNRIALFSTSEISYHGFPDPIKCPKDMSRKSLALYYYTNGRPEEEISADHNTIFRDPPGSEKKQRGLKRWLRRKG